MHTVDMLPIVLVGGTFLYIAYKIVSEFLTARRAM
jgi:hypothetical protein